MSARAFPTWLLQSVALRLNNVSASCREPHFRTADLPDLAEISGMQSSLPTSRSEGDQGARHAAAGDRGDRGAARGMAATSPVPRWARSMPRSRRSSAPGTGRRGNRIEVNPAVKR